MTRPRMARSSLQVVGRQALSNAFESTLSQGLKTPPRKCGPANFRQSQSHGTPLDAYDLRSTQCYGRGAATDVTAKGYEELRAIRHAHLRQLHDTVLPATKYVSRMQLGGEAGQICVRIYV